MIADAAPASETVFDATTVFWVEWLRDRLAGGSEAIAGRLPESPPLGPGEYELARRFDLDEIDLAIVWCAVAAELDATIASRIRRFHTDGSRDELDGETLVLLLGASTAEQLELRRRLSPGSPLFAHGLLRLRTLHHIDRRMSWPVRAAPTVLRALAGEAAVEDPMGGVAEWRTPEVSLEDVVLPPVLVDEATGFARVHDEAAQHFAGAGATGRGLVLLFTGPPGTGKTLLAEALAGMLGKRLLLVRVDRLLEDSARAAVRLTDLFLEAELHRAVVFFDECDTLFEAHAGIRVEHLRELERFAGVVILAANKSLALDAALQRRIAWVGRFPVPDAAARTIIWHKHLARLRGVALAGDVNVPLLAGRFALAGGYIRNAVLLGVHRALARGAEGSALRQGDLFEGAAAQLRGDVSEYAQKTHAKLTLESLVLPGETRLKVEQLLAACRHHSRFLYDLAMGDKLASSRGIVALFSGEPGTGKTLASEILAHELARPLHRVHIPAVVSRYVGDTEKNIALMFELARARDAILLFDEADGLFAARTSRVDSATDRFANMEVNQLLQEVERHDGLVFMTTNLKTNLDNALARRILFRIEFPMPDERARADIWRTLLPANFTDERDPPHPDALAATFDFAGGNIRNAVVRACYQALHESQALAHRHLEAAGAQECEAMGRAYRVKAPTQTGRK